MKRKYLLQFGADEYSQSYQIRRFNYKYVHEDEVEILPDGKVKVTSGGSVLNSIKKKHLVPYRTDKYRDTFTNMGVSFRLYNKDNGYLYGTTCRQIMLNHFFNGSKKSNPHLMCIKNNYIRKVDYLKVEKLVDILINLPLSIYTDKQYKADVTYDKEIAPKNYGGLPSFYDIVYKIDVRLLRSKTMVASYVAGMFRLALNMGAYNSRAMHMLLNENYVGHLAVQSAIKSGNKRKMCTLFKRVCRIVSRLTVTPKEMKEYENMPLEDLPVCYGARGTHAYTLCINRFNVKNTIEFFMQGIKNTPKDKRPYDYNTAFETQVLQTWVWEKKPYVITVQEVVI